MPKGVYLHTHIKPREYPQEIVDEVRRMYLECGMTVKEVQEALPKGFKAQRIIERHIPVRRTASKRSQRKDQNSCWKGDAASYAAVHLRLRTERGPARTHPCVDCGEGAHDWSYNGLDEHEVRSPRGVYSVNPNNYDPRCRSCHRQYDARMRKEGDANVQQEAHSR